MVTREAIAAEARTWIGTRWHHQASRKGVGADCIGLIVGVASALGIPEASLYKESPEFQGYGRQPDPERLLEGCARFLHLADQRPLQLSDILLLRFEHAPQHFALISRLDPVHIIHAYAQARRVVEHRLDTLWALRIVRAYTFRGLT